MSFNLKYKTFLKVFSTIYRIVGFPSGSLVDVCHSRSALVALNHVSKSITVLLDSKRTIVGSKISVIRFLVLH